MHGKHPHELTTLSRSPGRHARHNRSENFWSGRADRSTRSTSDGHCIWYGELYLSRTSQLTQSREGDGRCALRIYSDGETDSVSWYEIWQAAEAMYAICNKQGRNGWYRSIGKSQKLAKKTASHLQANTMSRSSG